eukprot:11189178-Lingulodinium_polyedra.AAC.1
MEQVGIVERSRATARMRWSWKGSSGPTVTPIARTRPGPGVRGVRVCTPDLRFPRQLVAQRRVAAMG